MAFPASSSTTFEALSQIKATAVRIRDQVTNLRNISAAGTASRPSFVNLQKQLNRAIVLWDLYSSTPGLSQYAKDQHGDQVLDIVAEYTAMRAAAVSLRDWIFNNMPKTGSSPLLYNLNADGTLTELTFTSSQTAAFRTECDALIATIS